MNDFVIKAAANALKEVPEANGNESLCRCVPQGDYIVDECPWLDYAQVSSMYFMTSYGVC